MLENLFLCYLQNIITKLFDKNCIRILLFEISARIGIYISWYNSKAVCSFGYNYNITLLDSTDTTPEKMSQVL